MRKLKKATDTASESTASTSPTTIPTIPLTAGLAFQAPAKDLARALRRISGCTDRRSSMPMLACVAIQATATEVTLCATDLNNSAAHVAPAWSVHGTGTVVVNAKALADVLKRLPDGEVTIRAAGTTVAPKLEISAGALALTMEALNAQDFPKLPPIRPGDPVLSLAKVSADQLADMIDAVKASVCRDEARFHMCGVLLEASADESRMVSTDGHRLCKVEAPALPAFKLDSGMIVPLKAITEIRKLLSKGECEIGTWGNKGCPGLLVRQGGTTIAVKAIDAQFPPYLQVIPTDHKRLVTAVERAAVVCTDTRGLALECVPGGLKLSADHPDLGSASETIPAELNPESRFKLGLNARYLREALATIEDARVTLSFGGELDPMIVRGTEDAAMRHVHAASQLVVIMPMRI